MKTKFLTIAGTGLLAGTLLISWVAGHEKKTENNKEETSLFSFKEVQQTDEYKQYRADQEKKISANEKQIADLKAKKTNLAKSDQDKYENKIDAIEKKNNALKTKIRANYKDEGKDKWESFKREFDHDMNELGQSIKDMGKDNVK